MRICFLILNSFDYDSRARLICNDIINQGWELDIIATTGGELNDLRGAKIHRIDQPVKPFRQRRFIEYNLKATELVSKAAYDIIHATDLDTLWAAVEASQSNNAQVLYEARELYVEQLAVFNRSLVKFLWRTLESRFIHRARCVVTINNSIASELVKRYGISEPIVAMNVADTVPVNAVDLRQKYDLNCRYVFIYQGILRPGQGILRLLRILDGIPHAGLVIIGDGPYRQEIEGALGKYGIRDRVRFAGMIPPHELANYTAGGDVGFLLMETKAMNNYLALPQKIFQYIGAGVPSVVADIPELRRVVETDDLGLVLERNNEVNDIEIMQTFLRDKLDRAKQNCKQIRGKYSWKKEGSKIINAYRGLI